MRLQAPGMSRSDFEIELRGESLAFQGEKRIKREFQGEGPYSIERSYGSDVN